MVKKEVIGESAGHDWAADRRLARAPRIRYGALQAEISLLLNRGCGESGLQDHLGGELRERVSWVARE